MRRTDEAAAKLAIILIKGQQRTPEDFTAKALDDFAATYDLFNDGTRSEAEYLAFTTGMIAMAAIIIDLIDLHRTEIDAGRIPGCPHAHSALRTIAHCAAVAVASVTKPRPSTQKKKRSTKKKDDEFPSFILVK